LLVEAALHHRLAPSVGGKLAVRQRGHDPRSSTTPGASNDD
jgi:hypothetical protein